VQGSTLGPRLFTIYCGGIPHNINAYHYTCYAVDSYVITKDKDLGNAIRRMEQVSRSHIEELERLGMKVNVKKSEVVIFTKKALDVHEVRLGEEILKPKKFMKVLGIYFDDKMTWEKYIRLLIAKCSSKLTVLRKI